MTANIIPPSLPDVMMASLKSSNVIFHFILTGIFGAKGFLGKSARRVSKLTIFKRNPAELLTLGY